MKEIVDVGCGHVAAPAAMGTSRRAMVQEADAARLEHTGELGDVGAELRFVDMDKHVEGPHAVNRFAFDRREVLAATDRKTGVGTVVKSALALTDARLRNIDADQSIAVVDEV